MSCSPDNPLLALPFHIPFDRIRPEHIEPAIDRLLAQAQAAVDAIAAAEPRYETTLGALERATEPLERAMSLVEHLESVVTTPDLREAYQTVQPRVAAFLASIPLHEGLWRALRAFASTEEARALPPERARLLRKTLDSFRRHGALLDPAGKQRLLQIQVELAQHTTRFAQNVVDATAAFEILVEDRERLHGLPEGVLELLRQGAAERGLPGYRLTLHEPCLVPALTYLTDAELRERLWRAYNRRAVEENRPLLVRILELRREQAALLGYPHFADLVLEDRMARSGQRALAFVEDLRQRSLSAFRAEHEALCAFRQQLEGRSDLAPWDLAFYAEKLRRACHDLDEEELRPYLPLPRVLSGLFALAERLYGLSIRPWDAPVWHDSVQAYAIHDGDGTMLAGFYLDLFPRDNKRGGAWMHPLRTGVPGEQDPRHLAVLAANVRPPVGQAPSLLSHRELETLLHEFGHLLHQCLSRVPVRSLGGTNVAWDFVELPSQLMENFAWERASLDLLSGHYQSGAPIPDELLDRMRRARSFRAATAMMRQLGFGCCDLRLHMEYDPARDGDVLAYSWRILSEHSPVPLPQDHAMLASFTHLFGSPTGYAAGYYSYKWAEVLEADAFSRFQEAGVLSAEVGRAFREQILERGDSRDPMELFVAFRGREPDRTPLLRRAGLAS
ncbi:MAG: M3 family metallopeptidase [Myxococcales bacterium]|nr:M3 family metallopeptidase [Myxococcota bacterium]MDW8282102.1 M3 family metallopeptidase [Myxococcales bacterium]